MSSSRREFLKTASIAGVACGLAGGELAQGADQGATDVPDLPTPQSVKKGEMLYRALGKTGEQVSLIGVGGFHIGIPKDEADGIKIVRSALDRGINFLDNCWDYHDGESEIRMGKALRDGYRAKAFLMTKIDGRTKEAAGKQIEESLRRLQTDHIDLLQHHEILRMEDPDRVFADGGSMEAFLEAKKAGKIRFIGFTGHKDPLVHLRMLEVAGQHGFEFDTAQMPLNVMDAHFRSFAHKVVPELVKLGVGVLGMKSMGDGNVLKSGKVTAIECLHYAMNLPTSVVITGMEKMGILDQAFEAVKSFQPMAKDQVAAILEKTKSDAMTGKFEPFKTTVKFDGTARNPQWLG
jgi:predicted aldo/keto reductase-like oxidoreductase